MKSLCKYQSAWRIIQTYCYKNSWSNLLRHSVHISPVPKRSDNWRRLAEIFSHRRESRWRTVARDHLLGSHYHNVHWPGPRQTFIPTVRGQWYQLWGICVKNIWGTNHQLEVLSQFYSLSYLDWGRGLAGVSGSRKGRLVGAGSAEIRTGCINTGDVSRHIVMSQSQSCSYYWQLTQLSDNTEDEDDLD